MVLIMIIPDIIQPVYKSAKALTSDRYAYRAKVWSISIDLAKDSIRLDRWSDRLPLFLVRSCCNLCIGGGFRSFVTYLTHGEVVVCDGSMAPSCRLGLSIGGLLAKPSRKTLVRVTWSARLMAGLRSGARVWGRVLARASGLVSYKITTGRLAIIASPVSFEKMEKRDTTSSAEY